MSNIIMHKGESRPFAHMFFFRLCDTEETLVNHFIELCVQYLSGHDGQQHFSVGTRALEMNRTVNAKSFEISVHMIFYNIDAYNSYLKSPLHEEFITRSAGMSPDRIVYDSYLHRTVETK